MRFACWLRPCGVTWDAVPGRGVKATANPPLQPFTNIRALLFPLNPTYLAPPPCLSEGVDLRVHSVGVHVGLCRAANSDGAVVRRPSPARSPSAERPSSCAPRALLGSAGGGLRPPAAKRGRPVVLGCYLRRAVLGNGRGRRRRGQRQGQAPAGGNGRGRRRRGRH